MVQCLAPERAPFVRTGLQPRRPFTQPFDFAAQLVDHAIRRAASTA